MKVLALLATLTLCVPSAEVAADDWIRLVGGPSYQISRGVSDSILPIPVQLTGVAAENVRLHVVDVLYNTRHEVSLIPSFAPAEALGFQVAPPVAGALPAILFRIDRTKVRGQGTYLLVLRAKAPGRDSVDLQVQLVIPPASIRLAHKVHLSRMVPWKPTDTLWLTLEETTGMPVGTVTMTMPSMPDSLASHFMLPARLSSMKGHDTQSVPIVIAEGMPLGKNMTGQVEVRAEELSAPVMLDFVLTNRWWPLPTIGILAVVGAGLGIFLKVVLKGRIELEEARVNGFELGRAIKADQQQRKDATFEEALNAALAPLLKAIDQPKSADIVAAVSVARAAWQAALSDLQTRKSRTAGVSHSIAVLAATNWVLPEGPDTALNLLRKAAATAEGLLANDNPTEADKQLIAGLEEARENLDEEIGKWRNHTLTGLHMVASNPRLPMPSPVAERLKPGLAEVIRLTSIPLPLPPTATETEFRIALQAIHDAQIGTRELDNQLRIWLTIAIDNLLRAMPSIATQVMAAHDQADRSLADALVKPELLSDQLGPNSKVAKLDSMIRELLGQALTLAQVPDRALVQNQVAEGNYLEAARAITLASGAQGRPEAGIINEAGIMNEGLKITPLSVWAHHTDRPASPWLSRGGAAVPTFETRPVTEASNLQNLVRARIVRTLIVFLLIVPGAFVAFGDSFIGTPMDFIKVFSWGFFLDFGIDSLAKILPQR